MNEVKFDKERTIDWLENNRGNGFFEGFLEDNIDFKQLSDEELKFYFYEWVLPDVEDNL